MNRPEFGLVGAAVGNYIGLRGPDYQVPLEWGAIRRFARSLYSTHADWNDDPRAVVPPTFLASAGYHWGYILERPPVGSELASIGVDRVAMMDGEQEFVFHGEPPRAGQVLTASTHVRQHFFKAGRAGGRLEFFMMQTDFCDARGRLVAEWRPTSIRTEKVSAQSFRRRSTEQKWWHKGETRPQLDAVSQVDDSHLVVGMATPRVTMPALTLTEIIRYQCASGEDSSTHHDSLAARSHGYPDVFSVAMLHAGVLGTLAAHWLGPRNIRRLRVRFLDLIWPGDVLSYGGTVTALKDGSDDATVDLELVCSRAGQAVVRAWAVFRRERPSVDED